MWYYPGMVRLSRLKGLRQRRAFSQQELAQKAGVDRSTISRLESDAEGAFPTTVRKLAAALDVAPEDLLDPRQTARSGVRPARPRRSAPARLPTQLAATPQAREFLQGKPEMTTLLREAKAQLERYFPQARLRLQLLHDPDYGEADELLLEVSTDVDEGEALDVLDRFTDEWWVHHVHRASASLVIDLALE